MNHSTSAPAVQSDDLPQPTSSFSRYVPLACWTLVLLTLLFISLKIISYGYLPGGDARRHVAKAFTHKPYTEIVVMRDAYSTDHSPGWEWILRMFHEKLGWNAEVLVSCSVVGGLLCIFLAPLPWLRRPEAWLAGVFGVLLARPSLIGNRLSQARPLLVTEGVLIALLFSWSKPNSDKPSWLKIVLTCIGFSLSVWIHGAWYLWVLLVAAFILARAWRSALWLTICWLLGTVAGAVLSGSPFELLKTAVATALTINREHPPQWMLVGEFAPDTGDIAVLMLLAIVFLWRRGQNSRESNFNFRPVIALMAMCWILGFKADRFWADWGIPAAMVWLTLQFQEAMICFTGSHSPRRLALAVMIAAPLFLHSTDDTNRRYTSNLSQPFLDASEPRLQGWFPDGNGIFYSVEMDLFYDTFYKNPQASWRYILGFEPALMPEEDLKIFRRIVWNHDAFQAYGPWINKMHPEDRLAIYSTTPPNLPRLEWINANQYIWIGRLPKPSPR